MIAPAVPLAKLRAWRDQRTQGTLRSAMFMSLPDAWYQDPHWLCVNGHVSARYLKSERSGSLCLVCAEPVLLGPPIGENEFRIVLDQLASGALK